MTEEFFKIENSCYEISKLGNVRRKFKNGKIHYLTPCKGTEGYYCISLSANNIKKGKSIHRLLALTFIPNPENKPCIDHIDRDTTNNNLDNLRWATYKENNNNKAPSKGCVVQTKDIIRGKLYLGYRATYYVKGIRFSKRYKIKENAEEWLKTNLGKDLTKDEPPSN